MITGYNTDIDHAGRVFHVQTEDKGLKNPVVETLIYSGGEIVTAKRTPYDDLTAVGSVAERELQLRMEAQHQRLIRDIRAGNFDSEKPKPFGYNIVSNHTLDEVVVTFLEEHCEEQTLIKLCLIDRQTLQEATRPTVRMKVVHESNQDPVADARVVVRLIVGSEPPLELFSAETDADGFVEASFEIPALPAERQKVEIVCTAEHAECRSELRRRVKRAVANDTEKASPQPA